MSEGPILPRIFVGIFLVIYVVLPLILIRLTLMGLVWLIRKFLNSRASSRKVYVGRHHTPQGA